MNGTIDSNLTQREQALFVQETTNKVALFKGSIFANDQNRDEELQISFALNSKYDGFNSSKQVEVKDGILMIKNVPVKLIQYKNFWQRQHSACNIDLVIDTTKPESEKLTKIKMKFQASEHFSHCFPHTVMVDLTPKDILKLYAKTLYYSVGLLCAIVFSIAAVIKQLRKTLVNY